MTRRCVIRADASVAIGGGHVVRCLALADALSVRGWQVAFATAAGTTAIVPDLAKLYPESLFTLQSDGGDVARVEAAFPHIDLLVFDGYAFDADYEDSFRPLATRLAAMDDAPTRRHATDTLIDQTLHRKGEEYSGLVPDATLLLCGASYASLRTPFMQARSGGLAPIATRDRLRVLVSFGLTDAANATSLLLAALDGLPVDVAVVMGNSSPHRASVESMVARHSADWKLLGEADAPTMAGLMHDADLVAGAPGSSSYERCCLGRPSVLLVVADNQRSNARQLAAAGCAAVLGDVRSLAADKAHEMLAQLICDRERLKKMAAAAAAVTDGRGAERIAETIGQRFRL